MVGLIRESDINESNIDRMLLTRAFNALKRYLHNDWLNVLSLFLVGMVLFCAAFGDIFIPYSPINMDLTHRLEPPSRSHLFGTDEFGRDIFSRVISGSRISLSIALVTLVIASGIGFIVGCFAGLAGGWTDEVIMRVTDMFQAFPALVLAMAIAATLGPSLENTSIALITVYWPWYARLVRGQVIHLRESEYILAARGLGASNLHLISRHLLPNLLPAIVTQMSLETGTIILSTAGLSFLGLGAQPPTPEWGAMILDAQQFIHSAWWCATFPGLALVLTCMGFNLLGDGLCDYLDPRL